MYSVMPTKPVVYACYNGLGKSVLEICWRGLKQNSVLQLNNEDSAFLGPHNLHLIT